jgi:signal transduction histidine kinase
MSLAEFIEADFSGLIDDWTDYALALSQEGSQLTESQLRNSAADILTAIAADMREAQNAAQQESKSRGNSNARASSFNQVAQRHAEDRLSHGYSINDVVAEFRSLRATVLRRWQNTAPAGAEAFQEMIRFNEAIDQVLAESVRHYAYRTERIRDLFAGVLAHDLRSPLGAILNAAEVLLHDDHPLARRHEGGHLRSARRDADETDDRRPADLYAHPPGRRTAGQLYAAGHGAHLQRCGRGGPRVLSRCRHRTASGGRTRG